MPDEFPWVTNVDFSASVAAAPWDYEEAFVQEITGTIHGMVSDTKEENFGTIKVLKVSAVEATNRRYSLESICDAHSDFLLSVFNAIFDEDEEIKSELAIEPAWHELIVLWEFNVAPEYRKTSVVVRAFETAIAFIGAQGLIVAAMDGEDFVGLELLMDEWLELGFYQNRGNAVCRPR